MAQSATRELQPEALTAFMALLQDVVEQRGSITLRAVKRFRADGLPATRKAEVAFSTGRVSVLRGLSPEVFLHAIAHEVTHLKRGPEGLAVDVDEEERVVEDEAQTLLYGSPRPAAKRERHLTLIPGGAR